MFAQRLTYPQIEWNANGKIKSIERTPSSTKSDLEFVYDASGNRIIKIVKPRDGNGVKSELHWTYTYYVRDASGNVMAVYNRTFEFVSGTDYKDKLNCSELHIYGSKRVGTSNVDSLLTFNFGDATFTDNYDNMFGAGSYDPITPTTPCTTTCKTNYRRKLGKKQYEVTNHLGNVLATVSDRRLSEDNYSYTASGSGNYKYDAARNMYYAVTAGTGTHNRVSASSDNKTDWYTADVISYSDYFAYGAQMDGRFGGQYRYTFNGQETESEIEDAYFYKYRLYDPRLGRFVSTDPLEPIYAYNSPYAFCENSTIAFVELEGLERYYSADGRYIGSYGGSENSEQIRITEYTFEQGVEIMNSNPEYQNDFNAHSSVAYTNEQDILDSWVRTWRPQSTDREFGMVVFSIDIYSGSPGTGGNQRVYVEGVTAKGEPQLAGGAVDIATSTLKLGQKAIGVAGHSMFADGKGWERSSMIHTHPAGKSTQFSIGGLANPLNGRVEGDIALALEWNIPIHMAHHDHLYVNSFSPKKYWEELGNQRGASTVKWDKEAGPSRHIFEDIVNCVQRERKVK